MGAVDTRLAWSRAEFELLIAGWRTLGRNSSSCMGACGENRYVGVTPQVFTRVFSPGGKLTGVWGSKCIRTALYPHNLFWVFSFRSKELHMCSDRVCIHFICCFIGWLPHVCPVATEGAAEHPCECPDHGPHFNTAKVTPPYSFEPDCAPRVWESFTNRALSSINVFNVFFWKQVTWLLEL
jgi:hypothetical protein